MEVRNKSFLIPRLLDLLHKHRVALALIDHPWFYRIGSLMSREGMLTTDFDPILSGDLGAREGNLVELLLRDTNQVGGLVRAGGEEAAVPAD